LFGRKITKISLNGIAILKKRRPLAKKQALSWTNFNITACFFSKNPSFFCHLINFISLSHALYLRFINSLLLDVF